MITFERIDLLIKRLLQTLKNEQSTADEIIDTVDLVKLDNPSWYVTSRLNTRHLYSGIDNLYDEPTRKMVHNHARTNGNQTLSH